MRRRPALSLIFAISLLAAGAARATTAPAPASTDTLDDLTWSADGSTLAGLLHSQGRTALRAYDGSHGVPRWTLELAGARDLAGDPVPPLDAFQISSDGDEVLLSAGGDLYLWRPASGAPARRLTRTEVREQHATLSPDGTAVAFVRDFDLWAIDVETGRETRLTDDGRRTGPHNAEIPDQIAGALGLRDQPPFAWSPLSRSLLFFRVPPSPPAPALTEEALGGAAAQAQPLQIAVVDLQSRTPQILETGDGATGTPVRARWRFDGRAIGVERLAPGRAGVDLLLCHPERAFCRPLATQDRSPELHLTDTLRFMGGGFVWGVDRKGNRGLAYFDALGRQLFPLLPAPWDLGRVLAVDPLTGNIVVLGLRVGGSMAGESTVLVLDVHRSTPRVLAAGSGFAEALFDPAGKVWVRGWRDADGVFQRVLEDVGGKVLAHLPPPGKPPSGISVEELP